MATKALNMKFEESELDEIKSVTAVFHMTLTDFFKEAACDKLKKLKADPFYRLTTNVADASEDEAAEILDAINSLTDDDLSISSRKKVTGAH